MCYGPLALTGVPGALWSMEGVFIVAFLKYSY